MRSPLLQLVIGVAMLSSAPAQEPVTNTEPSALIETKTKRQVIKLDPGPWGTLEYYQIPLELPPGYLNFLTTPSQQVEWRFFAETETELEALLLGAGLTADEITAILKGAKVLADPEIMRVFPADEVILKMPAPTRAKLYRFLARSDGNRFHQHPIYIDSENLSYWFEGTTVPRGAIEDVASLAYPTPKGRGYFLADLPFTLRRVASAREEKLLLQGILRQQALIVRLRLTRESLTPEIAEYWTAGYKNKAVMPILDSVVQGNDGGAIDIAHLLPATPRQYLNRYPTPADGANGRYPDWFWSCYNFFRFAPREVYSDSPDRDALIIEEFEPSLPPLQFGDVILLNSGTKVIHGCVFIADDIVFTKNGSDLFTPWVLMKLEDVVALHDLQGDASLSVYRKTE